MARKKNWEMVKYRSDFALRPWGELTAFQQDILACAIVALRERQRPVVTFSKKRLECMLQRRIRSDRICNQIAAMQITSIRASYEDEKIAGQFVIFPGIWVDKKTGDISIQVNEKYMGLFNNLTERYLQWSLGEHLILPTAYSKTLYRYLCNFADTGWWRISIKDFRRAMRIPSKYDTRAIVKEVVNPSVSLLRELLPLKFSDLEIEKIKNENDGKTIEVICFKFTPFEASTSDSDWDDLDEPW